MSRQDRARPTDHFSATSHAGDEADESHDVRQAAGRRHRLQTQRLQADRVAPSLRPTAISNRWTMRTDAHGDHSGKRTARD